jgi:hypothetical protein
MSRATRIIIASVVLAVAIVGLASVAIQMAETYYLPPGPNGASLAQNALFGPAVVGTVVTSVLVLILLAHLLAVTRRLTPRWMWIVAAALALGAVGVPIVVAAFDRPAF